jgi:hypothetical protein
MKSNLRSTCLLFLVFLFFSAGFVGMVSANDDPYNYTILEKDNTICGKVDLPEGDYPIWGYINRSYNFNEVYKNVSKENYANTTMVFYWNCLKGKSDYSNFALNNTSHWKDINSQNWKCNHTWNKTGNYSVAVGVFKPYDGSNAVSFWIPIKIVNDTNIKVQSFSMLNGQNSFAIENSIHSNNLSFSNLINSSENYSEKKYCGYLKNDYSFSVKLSAISRSREDNRTINETTTVVYWDNKTSDSNVLDDINNTEILSENNSSNITHKWAENFTHEWDKTGEKNISSTAFYWDPFDWSEIPSNCNNTSILIIRDPKNFVYLYNPFSDTHPIIAFVVSLIIPLIEPFTNIQNWGIFLITAGLVILFFAFTKNTVPVKISLFRLKTFYLKSVDSFTGIFTFVTGMYLYFVFGRCPWDIPIISSLPWLPNVYFSMLYYEYQTNSLLTDNKDAIPYLSILLGLVDVFASSMIIYGIGIPFLKGESKSGKFFREILRGERFFLPRPSTQQFSVQLKGLFILLKEKVKRISLTDQRGDRFPGKSGKKEEILISPKT